MMKSTKKFFVMCLALCGLITFSSCDDDVDPVVVLPTGDEAIYNLAAKNGSGVSGTVKFEKLSDGSTLATIQLTGTTAGNSHPAHIHKNSAAEGGAIAVTFNPIDGATGTSVTTITGFDDNTTIRYEDIIAYDGYVNVHLSVANLAVVSQGDIGTNKLVSGASKTYNLGARNSSGISGTITFAKRISGETLATIDVNGTSSAVNAYPAHIHKNSAAETGAIAFTFNKVDSASGMSTTNIAKLDNGTAITYDALLAYDGYVNVHRASDLGVVAQADIGTNELTGDNKEYTLGVRNSSGISGTITFAKRISGETLATIDVDGTSSAVNSYPAHIHNNSAVEGGGVKFTFNKVDSASGMSMTNIAKLDDGTDITYETLLDYDGYVNVHRASDGGVVSQGDIGGNELTGDEEIYTLNQVNVSGVSGTVKFEERKSGAALATISLTGTTPSVMHPAHIHAGSIASPGAVAISFNKVDGTTGMSITHIEKFDDDSAFSYDALLTYNGYVNVHLSETIGTVVANANIGSNE